jgi:hypothetical protein
MIDGLGVAGWGVGGIEAEATMLGQVHLKWALFSFNDKLTIVSNLCLRKKGTLASPPSPQFILTFH